MLKVSRTAVRDERILGHSKQHKMIREIGKGKLMIRQG